MTPKEQYEARKAERKKLVDLDYQVRQREEQIATLDMLDRFVTAAERIADALERGRETNHFHLQPNHEVERVGECFKVTCR